MKSESELAGVYVHIPFCISRCSYCDFATEIYRDPAFVDRYVKAVCSEIYTARLNSSSRQHQINTIYFGGGTPSLLSPNQLEQILNAVDNRFVLDESNLEITLEINPATVSAERLRDFRSLGINRASFGVQTFNERLLKTLSRRHTAEDALQTFRLLRASGYDNVSLDLIVGLPRQTLRGWQADIQKALNLRPEHLSLYILEVHENTPLAQQISSGRQPPPDDSLTAKMYELIIEKLSSAGYQQYEISNFSLPGFQSKHNLKYWKCLPVFGFGVSAFSFCDTERWSNERNTARYVELIENGRSPVVFREQVNLASEYAFLGLRLSEGIQLSEYKRRFGFALEEKFSAEIEQFQNLGLIEIRDGYLRLTSKGFLYSNEVFAIFV
ncbi:MAG: radical SAM family heme chaperone HemW [Acidobacteria bacterium]|nr:MAG: radical SAM family heme chaperone HemW [Acidobacteriota bacterium]